MSSKKGKRKMGEEKNEVEEIEKVGKIAESEDEALGDLDLDRLAIELYCFAYATSYFKLFFVTSFYLYIIKYFGFIRVCSW